MGWRQPPFRAETSIIGLVLTAGTAILEPGLGIAKRRIGARLGSAATAGEGTQNLLCAYLAIAVFAGLLANTLFGAWWLDGVLALAIGGWAVIEGRRAWVGQSCACACQAGVECTPKLRQEGEFLDSFARSQAAIAADGGTWRERWAKRSAQGFCTYGQRGQPRIGLRWLGDQRYLLKILDFHYYGDRWHAVSLPAEMPGAILFTADLTPSRFV